jgi:hypothetical protein
LSFPWAAKLFFTVRIPSLHFVRVIPSRFPATRFVQSPSATKRWCAPAFKPPAPPRQITRRHCQRGQASLSSPGGSFALASRGRSPPLPGFGLVVWQLACFDRTLADLTMVWTVRGLGRLILSGRQPSGSPRKQRCPLAKNSEPLQSLPQLPLRYLS